VPDQVILKILPSWFSWVWSRLVLNFAGTELGTPDIDNKILNLAGTMCNYVCLAGGCTRNG